MTSAERGRAPALALSGLLAPALIAGGLHLHSQPVWAAAPVAEPPPFDEIGQDGARPALAPQVPSEPRPAGLGARTPASAGSAPPNPAAGTQDPVDPAARMLARMSRALRSLDYEGTLVYLMENRLEALHLVHRVSEGRVQERLLSLNGPIRAVTREHDRVTCVMPDGHPISVEGHGGRSLLRTRHIDPAALADSYRVGLLGGARVAGRDTDVIALEPLDTLRYGLRFYLDRATGLPLKSDLIDREGESLEQIMFTSLTLGSPLAPTPDGGDPPPAAVAREEGAAPPGPVRTARWRFDRRPAGFELAMHDVLRDAEGAEVEQFVFSDGVSAYSVYVEAGVSDGLEGVTRVGVVHAAGRRLDGYQLTAVGEVPAATVEAAVAGARMAAEPTASSPAGGG